MTEKTKIFPTKAMYKLGGGDEELVTYDFSILEGNIFAPFFNTLPNMIYKKCKKMCFSCEMEYNYEKSGKPNMKRLETIKKSISYQKQNFLGYLIKILCKTLPKTRMMKSLEFSSVDIPSNLLMELFSAIGNSTELEEIYFRNVRVEDADFQYLLSVITPYQFKVVSFTNCCLTSQSFASIRKFILRASHGSSKKERKLCQFNVDDNNFTVDELNMIEQMTNESREKAKLSAKSSQEQRVFNIDERDNCHVIKERSVKPPPKDDENEEDSDVTIDQSSESSEDSAPRSNRAKSYYSQIKSYKGSSPKSVKVNPLKDEDFSNEKFETKEQSELPKVVPYYAKSIKNMRKKAHKNRKIVQESQSSDDEELFDMEIGRMKDPKNLSNDEIKAQNKQLESILNSFMKKYNVTKYSDDCFVMGEGSKELVESVYFIKQQIETYQSIRETEEQYKDSMLRKSPLDDNDSDTLIYSDINTNEEVVPKNEEVAKIQKSSPVDSENKEEKPQEKDQDDSSNSGDEKEELKGVNLGEVEHPLDFGAPPEDL